MASFERMMDTLARHQDLIVYVNLFGLGSNKGGRYISLYNQKANMRLVQVYEESWPGLPAKLIEQAASIGVQGEIPIKRDEAQSAGLLHDCAPMEVFRYKPPRQKDNAPWKFNGLNGVEPASPAKKAAVQQLPKKVVNLITELVQEAYGDDWDAHVTNSLKRLSDESDVHFLTIGDITPGDAQTWIKFLKERIDKKPEKGPFDD